MLLACSFLAQLGSNFLVRERVVFCKLLQNWVITVKPVIEY